MEKIQKGCWRCAKVGRNFGIHRSQINLSEEGFERYGRVGNVSFAFFHPSPLEVPS